MPRRNTLVLIITLALFSFAICALIYPLFGREKLRLGLDLVGGVHLVYQAQFPEGTTVEEQARGMNRALEIIRTRIDKYGVTEPTIQKLEIAGKDCISVKLPGFTDIEEARKLVKQTGFLEFRMVELNEEGNPVYLSNYLENDQAEFFDKDEDDTRLFAEEWYEGGIPVAILVRDGEGNLRYLDGAGNPVDVEELKRIPTELRAWIPARGQDGTTLTGAFLEEATAVPDQQAGIVTAMKVAIVWSKEGGEIFNQVAERIYNSGPLDSDQRDIGIFLDDELISAPQILQPLYEGGRGEITGGFDIPEATRLSHLLESGALPMPLGEEPLYQDPVSATRGTITVEMAIMAGLIGIVLVMLFMILYYRLPGLVSSLALVFYGALVLALFKLIPVTLTLAGIGGFVLSIGMAVDANILIFERMKEELRAGRTLGAAIEVGFNRAWTAIRDSNITTFIVCGILYWVGSSIIAGEPVMGFALTLFIGVAVSMFTAIVVTRTLLRLFVGTRLAQRTRLFSPHLGRKDV